MDRFVVKASKKEDKIDLLAKLRDARPIENSATHEAKRKTASSRNSDKTVQSKRLENTISTAPTSFVQGVGSSGGRMAASEEWAARSSRVVSILDVSCQARAAQMKANSFVGWKTDREGHKVYNTFRNGERVSAGGQEGFKLSCGDGKSQPAKSTSQRAAGPPTES